MFLRWRRREYRHPYWPLLVAGLLSACGGGVGIIAVLQIVTPIAGDWEVKNPITLLQFNDRPNDLFNTMINVTARISTDSGVCSEKPNATDIELEGTIDNGALVLRRVDAPNNTTTCLQGTFTDLITLKAGPPAGTILEYENTLGVVVNMDLGLWVSDGSGQLKLKFIQPSNDVGNDEARPVSGCDWSSGSGVRFDSDDMNGFNTITRAKPTIPEIRSSIGGPILFSNVVFEDGATLTLFNVAFGERVTLHRQPDDPETPCP